MGRPAASREASHTKGAALKVFFDWYGRKYGRVRLTRAFEQTPADLRTVLDPNRDGLGVLASTWYPDRLIHALMTDMLLGFSTDEQRDLAREGTFEVVQGTLRGVYKTLFALLMTPDRLARNLDKLWRSYHDTGTTQITVESARRHRSRLSGWVGHHPFICMMNRYGYEALYTSIGCKNVVVTDDGCVSNGNGACTFIAEWS